QDAASAMFIITGESAARGTSFETHEIWSLMRALAAGATLEALRFETSPALYAVLQERIGEIDIEKVRKAVDERFGEEEFEETLPAVFGVSRVNFPRRRRGESRRPRPISSPTARISS